MTTVATLVIYAYSSFVSSWGMGPVVAKEFEKTCSCKVELVNGGDGGALLNKLKLEGDQTRADLVLGLDETLLPRAHKILKWEKLAAVKVDWEPGMGLQMDGEFAPFDRGPFAFVYDSEKTQPPSGFEDLLAARFKGRVLLEDPRTSTPGLGFLLWVIAAKKQTAWDYLAKLNRQKKVISPSWDLAYGLFKKGEGTLVMSYWTSPAYHIQEEKVFKYKAARFEEGHYEQVEYAGIPSTSGQKALARKFIDFIYSDFFQQKIASKNFMLPVRKGVVLPEAFKSLGEAKVMPRFKPAELEKNLEEWLTHWRDLF